MTASSSSGSSSRAREQLRLAHERLLASDPVDRAVARRRDDPRAWVRRRPVARPALRGPDEGVLHRVLGEVEIAEDAAEDRDATRTLVPVGAGEVVYARLRVVDDRPHLDRAALRVRDARRPLDRLVERLGLDQ